MCGNGIEIANSMNRWSVVAPQRFHAVLIFVLLAPAPAPPHLDLQSHFQYDPWQSAVVGSHCPWSGVCSIAIDSTVSVSLPTIQYRLPCPTLTRSFPCRSVLVASHPLAKKESGLVPAITICFSTTILCEIQYGCGYDQVSRIWWSLLPHTRKDLQSTHTDRRRLCGATGVLLLEMVPWARHACSSHIPQTSFHLNMFPPSLTIMQWQWCKLCDFSL
jgi:hypothetical protein